MPSTSAADFFNSGGSSTTVYNKFNEIPQGTGNPLVFTSTPSRPLSFNSAASIYDVSTVYPGVPGIVYDMTVSNDTVFYVVNSVLDCFGGYAVAYATKYTQAGTIKGIASGAYNGPLHVILINLTTGAVYSLNGSLFCHMSQSGGGANGVGIQDTGWFIPVIGGDGFLYILECNPSMDNYQASIFVDLSNGNSADAKKVAVTIFNLSTGAKTSTVFASGSLGNIGIWHPTIGTSNAERWTSYVMVYRPTSTTSGGKIFIAQSTYISNGTYSGPVDSHQNLRVVSLYNGTASGSVSGGSESRNSNVLANPQLRQITGGMVYLAHYTNGYSYYPEGRWYHAASDTLITPTRSGSGGSLYSAYSDILSGQGATSGEYHACIMKVGSGKFCIVKKVGPSTFRLMLNVVGSGPDYKDFTLTSSSTAVQDPCVPYGSSTTRFLCGNIVYAVDYDNYTISVVKTLFTGPGSYSVLVPTTTAHSWWTKVIFLYNSVSGMILQLNTSGVNTDLADPPIVFRNNSDLPPGFDIMPTSGDPPASFKYGPNNQNTLKGIQIDGYFNYLSTQNSGLWNSTINCSGFGGLTTPGDLSTDLTSYSTTGKENLVLQWNGLNSASSISSSTLPKVVLSSLVPVLSGSSYKTSALYTVPVAGVSRFGSLRFVFNVPAFTNSSTVPVRLVYKVVANGKLNGSLIYQNLRIVNTPSQGFYILSGSEIAINIGVGTNVTPESITLECDPILTLKPGDASVTSSVYRNPLQEYPGLLVDGNFSPLGSSSGISITTSSFSTTPRLIANAY